MATTSASAATTSSSSSNTSTTASNVSASQEETHHLLWSRSRVYVHPTPYSRDNIPGYLALVRKGPSIPRAPILLSYLPQALLLERDEVDKFVKVERRRCGKGKQRESQDPQSHLDVEVERGEHLQDEDVQVTAVDVLDPETLLKNSSESGISDSSSRTGSASASTSPTSYAFSIPLSQLHSLRVCPPSILGVGSWHGTVNLNTINGVSLPTLYFHDDDSSSMREGAAESIVKNANSTTSYPPLPPRNGSQTPTWGGDELLREAKKYSNVLRSVLDSKLFLIDPSRQDFEAHSTILFDDDAIDPTLPNKSKSSTHPNGNRIASSSSQYSNRLYPDDPFSQTSFGRPSDQLSHPEAQMDPFTVWAKSTKMSVLTQFSQITQHARKASSNLLSHPLVRPHLIPGPVQSFAQAGPEPLGGPSDLEWKEISNKSGLGEYDSARVYLAKWSRLVAEEGERNRRKEESLLSKIDNKNDVSANKDDESGELGIFEILGKSSNYDSHSDLGKIKSSRISNSEISLPEWKLFFDPQNGRPLLTFREMKARVFSRGLASDVRKFAWPFLLGFLPYDSTARERENLIKKKREEFERLKSNWKIQEERLLMEDEGFKEQKHRVKVDCLRTDRGQEMFKNLEITEAEREEWMNRVGKPGDDEDEEDGPRPKTNPNVLKLEEILLTYGFWDQAATKQVPAPTETDPSSNPGPLKGEAKASQSSLDGYVQGMSDLCAPLFVVLEGDESSTFWCFAGMMRRMRSNFLADQSGMKQQLLELQSLIRTFDPKLYSHLERADALNLFFCFRWLLICFKREFSFNDVLKLWECVWSCEPDPEMEPPSIPTQDSQATLPTTDSSTSIHSASTAGLTCQFHLFVALSILETHRDQVIRYLENFDEILQYYNGLAHNMDLEEVIEKAEISVKALRKLVERRERLVGKEGEATLEIPEELKNLVKS